MHEDRSRPNIERRQETRVTTNRRGVIRSVMRGQGLPCTIHNLTQSGAGLSVGSAFGIPRTFNLSIEGEPFARFCRVVWSEGKMLGVAFE